MPGQAAFSSEEARRVGEQIGIDWASSPFDVDQFRRGMDVELEHGRHDLGTNVTDDDPIVRQDRARPPERVSRLLHPARTDGGAGEAGARHHLTGGISARSCSDQQSGRRRRGSPLAAIGRARAPRQRARTPRPPSGSGPLAQGRAAPVPSRPVRFAMSTACAPQRRPYGNRGMSLMDAGTDHRTASCGPRGTPPARACPPEQR